jgi:hypothetical protein
MEKRNSYKKTEDFLFDLSFLQWLIQKEDLFNSEKWTIKSPDLAKLIEEARLWMLAFKVEETQLSTQVTELASQNTWEKMKDSSNRLPKTKGFGNLTRFRSAAALIVIGLFSIIYLFTDLKTGTNKTITHHELVEKDYVGLIEQFNISDKPQLITLLDASSVLMQPKSRLSNPKTFNGNECKVHLFGEGYFVECKDLKNRFFVYANETVTKVFGTSFKVFAYINQPKVEVLVRMEKVKVSSNNDLKNLVPEEVILRPNQASRFVRRKLLFEKMLDIT